MTLPPAGPKKLRPETVAATAARLLGSAGGRVIAFTAVPRKGYDGPAPRNRILDEGPYAAATAALYPNMEHVLIRSEGRSPFDDLDHGFYLFDRPTGFGDFGWVNSIFDAVRDRKLTVLLNGRAGNWGLSYDGMELLPELCPSRSLAPVIPGRAGARWPRADAMARVFPLDAWTMVSRCTLALAKSHFEWGDV